MANGLLSCFGSCFETFRTQEYYLDKIGERDPLEEDGVTRSVLTLVATGTRVKR